MSPLARRDLLRAGALGAVAAALPAVAACTAEPEGPREPDPLAELAATARADAATATAIADAVPDLPELSRAATEIATARAAHATELQREVDRERPPESSARPAAPTPEVPNAPARARATLADALTATEQRIIELITEVPAYRAGLLGSVAASCASLREVLN